MMQPLIVSVSAGFSVNWEVNLNSGKEPFAGCGTRVDK